MIVDFRKLQRGGHDTIHIEGAAVERVSNFKFLGVYIKDDLTWSMQADSAVKTAQKRLYFLRRLKKFGMSSKTLKNFYRCTIESILSGCITAWYGSCSACRSAQKRLYFLRRLKKFGMSSKTLKNFYRCTIESILSGCITAWYGSCSAA